MASEKSGERAFAPKSDGHVGVFYERNSKKQTSRNVFANQELVIGRDPKTCQHTIDEPTISHKHLRIYTIIFDQENPGQVAPLIYAQDLSWNGTFWNGRRMWNHNGGVLLSDGDILRVAPGVELEFRCAKEENSKPFDPVQLREMKVCVPSRFEMVWIVWLTSLLQRIDEEYIMTERKLGAGGYGQVYMAIERKTSQQVACKIIDIRVIRKKRVSSKSQDTPTRLSDTDQQAEIKKWSANQRKLRYIEQKVKLCHREAEILEKISHPNIINIERVFKTPCTMYIFQDLVTAGDLFSFLEFKQGKLLDIEAAVIVRQIAIALDYLHDQDIVHRDLKPDNILMTSLSVGARVVLTDFGCARVVTSPSKRMSTVMGTREYTAPEVIFGNRGRKGYTKAVDLWSLGCVTAVLLTGGSPFIDPITKEYSQKLANECDLKTLTEDENWKKAGERAKNFVSELLVLNENNRMTAKEALEHPWFTNEAHKEEFEKVYDRAVQGWKPRGNNRRQILSDHTVRGRRERRRWPRPALHCQGKIKPIDPNYMPYPDTFGRILYPKISPPSGPPVLSPEKLPSKVYSQQKSGTLKRRRESTPTPSRPSKRQARGSTSKDPVLPTDAQMLRTYQRLQSIRQSQTLNDLIRSQTRIFQNPLVEMCGGGTIWDIAVEGISKETKQKLIARPPTKSVPHSRYLPAIPDTKFGKENDSMGQAGSHVRRPYSPEAWDRKTDISKPPPKFPDLDSVQQYPESNIRAETPLPEEKGNIQKYLIDIEAQNGKSDNPMPTPKFPGLNLMEQYPESNIRAERPSREHKVDIPKYPTQSNGTGSSLGPSHNSNRALKRPRKEEHHTLIAAKRRKVGEDVYKFEDDDVVIERPKKEEHHALMAAKKKLDGCDAHKVDDDTVIEHPKKEEHHTLTSAKQKLDGCDVHKSEHDMGSGRPRREEHHILTAAKKRKSGDGSQFDHDEVFEEIENGISGKRRRVAYGQISGQCSEGGVLLENGVKRGG
ncbi:hypothetical protein FQN54_000005 [Arachnomyces sp. PD_36]|nr:hypothetical protein FQN54_000005 [Arachnomyces sp. PD_36]